MDEMESAMIDTYQYAKNIRMNSESNRGSMLSTVNRLHKYLCSTMLPESYFQGITPILEIFPDALADTFMLEYTLEEERDRPDFSLCFWNQPSIARIFAGEDPFVHLPAYLLANSIWCRFREFWIYRHNNPALFQDMANFWLEFDMIAEKVPDFPVPSVFLRVNSHDYRDWFMDGLEIIMDQVIPSPVKQQLQKLFTLLPENARVSQIGSLQARNQESLRLYVRMADHRQMFGLLDQLGYPGDLKPLAAFIDSLAGSAGYLKLQFNMGPEILPKIAIELLNPPEKAGWKPLIENLITHRLCTGAYHEFLLNWPDSILVQEPKARNYLLLYKYISHLKIIYEPGVPLSAKAYLGVTYS
jgi:hypothetical protein